MTGVDWRIKGLDLNNCNCAFGCPCQFNALPTNGDCEAVIGGRIDEGHFGDTRLDGLCWVMTVSWPGAVHEGNGTMQVIVDERADEDQRKALVTILHGEQTQPGATFFQVYRSTMSQVLEPLFRPIEFEADIDARTARLCVPGMIESSSEPVRNPVTGEPHRARMDLPQGFEYRLAEVASGTSTATGAMQLDIRDSHAHLAILHMTQNGVVE